MGVAASAGALRADIPHFTDVAPIRRMSEVTAGPEPPVRRPTPSD